MRFVTIQKFSELTGLPVKTVRIALNDGRLQGAPFGKRKLVDTQAYEDRLDGRIKQLHQWAREVEQGVGLI